MANGDGEFRGVNGSFYKGKWKDDRPHGKGIETNKNGEIYDGEFVDGKKHGYGEMNFMDGSIYRGEFRLGEMHGKVRLPLFWLIRTELTFGRMGMCMKVVG